MLKINTSHAHTFLYTFITNFNIMYIYRIFVSIIYLMKKNKIFSDHCHKYINIIAKLKS